MFIRLFAALLVVAVASAEIDRLSELITKNVDGVLRTFKPSLGRCMLFVNTASKSGNTKANMKWLRYVEKDFPEVYVTVVPSNDFGNEPKSNEALSDLFEFYDGIDEVLAKQDLDTSELFQFLTKQSGVAPQGDYYKYLVWKDGVTVTAYNHRAGPVEIGEIQYDLGNCLKS